MGRGFLKVQLHAGDYSVHGDPTTVLIKRNGEILYNLETDENGATPTVEFECPDLAGECGLKQKSYFTTVDVYVQKAHGYMGVSVYGVQIFDEITSILNVHVEPIVSGEPDEEEIYVSPEHGVDEDRPLPDYEYDYEGPMDVTKMEPFEPREIIQVFNPEPIDIDEYVQTFRPSDAPVPAEVPLANEVVIPEFITVHLGSPNANARNVRVRFRDYIVNVACSEIYPFWHPVAIEANVYAQISFALNRLFTHWYRSRGRAFDITNNTQFDQKFIYGREIFQNVALIVDGIFNRFVRRPGRVEPFFTQYCNGTTSTCPGMSQHGSQALALRGYSALEILRHYYPSDVNIVMSTNFGLRNPGAYPGTALREGSSGENVRRMQLYLNRISGNWWIPAIQNPNGFCSKRRSIDIVPQNNIINKHLQQYKKPVNQPPTFTKKSGATIYKISIFFSQTSKKTIEDKLLSAIEREVRLSASTY